MNAKLIAGVASMLVLAPSFGQAAKKKKIERKDQRPNILFILADDMGASV